MGNEEYFVGLSFWPGRPKDTYANSVNPDERARYYFVFDFRLKSLLFKFNDGRVHLRISGMKGFISKLRQVYAVKMLLEDNLHWYEESKVLGPVVQSIISLTSSLRVISLTVLADSIHNILIFIAEKM